jgi:tellurite methyltransferase
VTPLPPASPSYDARYAAPGWYWGRRPTGLCRAVVRLKTTLGRRSPSLVDLGTGEGRDLLHFARHGFRATGIDISEVGLAKARRRLARAGLSVQLQRGDIRTVRLAGPFDVVFSSGAVNNLPPSIRARRFAQFQRATRPGGLNAVNAFVPKPYLARPPERDPAESPYRAGELLGYYSDWQIVESGEVEFDCQSSGVAHRHALDIVIARKPG